MHYFIYPTQDAFISNASDQKDKNFGLDEMLSIGVSSIVDKLVYPTKTYSYQNEFVSGLHFDSFTGTLTGSIFGTFANSNGIIVGINEEFTASYFSGSVSGSINGNETGSIIINSNFSGSLFGFSGSIIAYNIFGNITSSVYTECFTGYTGTVTSATGSISGVLTGDEIKNKQNTQHKFTNCINRSLLKFDILYISQSISNANIINPKFYLKLNTTEAHELPTTYKIYAFPISKSWDQGDGNWAENGSSNGVSWNWQNYYSGSSWYSPYTNTVITTSIDYLSNYAYVTESFKRGGSVWYNLPATQSFSYQTSDINMDVTNIVNAWLTSTIPNEGFVLMYSDEVNVSASHANIYYFSKETNTVYSPRMDIMWDDSVWTTGSLFTSSVNVSTYNPRFSGSITNTASISGIIASGSISGNAYFVFNADSTIDSASIMSFTGTSGNIKTVGITGNVTGTSSIETNSIRQISASFYNGDFSGCDIYCQYSSSMVTGKLSGSFNSQILVDHMITGQLIDTHTSIYKSYQNSVVGGNMVGAVVSGTFNGGIFNGVVTNGLLIGADVSIPFTGSYSFITSSYSFTSSISITGSALEKLDTSKPFVVSVQNLKPTYSSGDLVKINVIGRPQFPLKTFPKSLQQLTYVTTQYLPTSSYYAVKDAETEEIIINFDNYTKISCDSRGNYFNLDTTGLAQERYYKVLIRIDSEYGVYTFDTNNLFKIRR